MKKVIKGLAVVATTAILGVGIGAMAGCAAKDGVYEGSYSYTSWGNTYGVSVKVTVKNNIITKVEDTTAQLHADWHSVSAGWEDYYKANSWLWTEGNTEDVTLENGIVEYTIVTKDTLTVDGVSNWRPKAFTFKITVGADKKIADYQVITNGSAPESYAERMPKKFQNGTWFVGKSLDDLKSAFGDDLAFADMKGGLTDNELATGATQSDYICVQAAAYALANRDAQINVFLNGGAASLQYRSVVDSAKVAVYSGTKVPSNPIPKPEETAIGSYAWTNETAANWTTNEAYILQKYVGLSVADVLDATVYVKDSGEPYEKDKNTALEELGVLITGATQGSGRLLLAIQNALGK